jgi:hypothetical protein
MQLPQLFFAHECFGLVFDKLFNLRCHLQKDHIFIINSSLSRSNKQVRSNYFQPWQKVYNKWLHKNPILCLTLISNFHFKYMLTYHASHYTPLDNIKLTLLILLHCFKYYSIVILGVNSSNMMWLNYWKNISWLRKFWPMWRMRGLSWILWWL